MTTNEEGAGRSAVMSARDEVISRLQEGRLSPGQRLVTSELAEELNISRGPVREALHILAGEGVVELLQNKGARIRPISNQDILDVLRLLSALGGLAMELGAARMKDDAARSAVEATLDRVVEALESHNAMRFYRELQSFHHTLNSIVGNASLNNAFAHLHMEYFNRTLASIVPGDHWQQFEKNYRAISRYLLSGRGEDAKAAYQAHLGWVVDMIQEDQAG
jgi:DNA-binding GntR family transcriptional regulator